MHRQVLRFPVPSECLRIHPQGLGELRHGQMRVTVESGPDLIWDDIKNVPNGRHGVGMHISLLPGVVGLSSGTYDLTMSPPRTRSPLISDEPAMPPSIPQKPLSDTLRVEAVRGIHHETSRTR
jgi:hypothetical protein